MKKNLVYCLFVALLFCGCQVEEMNGIEPEAKVFTAIIEDSTSGETKTSLDGSGNVLWKMGDQVSIFAASTVNEQYQVSDDSDGKTSATLNKVGGSGFIAGTEINNNVAFYPYASAVSIAKSGTSYIISNVSLPATQNYAAASFGNGAFPMTAVTSSTEDMNLKFKNVLGGLKLQLKGSATIASISITGKNNEKLYGDAEITVSNGSTPSISLTDATAKTVTLDCGAGVALNTETATPFIIALPPITMTGGFTVIVTDTEGKQMEISTTKSQTIPRSSLLKMPVVNYVGTPAVDYASMPLTLYSTGNTSVRFNKSGTTATPSLEYRKGSDSWATYTFGSTVELSDGESLQFRAGDGGNSTFSGHNYRYGITVSGTGTVAVSGNIMSLLDNSLQRATLPAYAFYQLFSSQQRVVDASNLILPVMTLVNSCYGYMFSGCTGLTSAPVLPATSLAESCYYGMFSGCTALITAPELPSTTLATNCYCYMFNGCTELNTAPDLPATILANSCYESIFRDCTGLTAAPQLSATTLAKCCYQGMFYGCTGLTDAPLLPATTLVDYCYQAMFYGCSNINYIKMLATNVSATDCLKNWVNGVSATGTFVKNASANWNITGDNGVPSGWTVQTE